MAQSYLPYVVVGFLLLFSLIALILGSIAVNKAKPGTCPEAEPTKAPPTKSCDQGCKDAAKIMVDAMNTSIDPCDDFYTFACGQWDEKHPLPEGKKRRYILDSLQVTVFERMIPVLDNLSTYDHTSSAVQKAGTYYDICVDARKAGVEDVAGVAKLMEDLDIVWPMATNDSVTPPDSIDKLLAKLHQHFYDQTNLEDVAGPIISPTVYVDEDKKLINRDFTLYLDQGALGLQGRDYYINENYTDQIEQYKKDIKAIAMSLANEAGKDISKTIDADVDEVVAFETELAKIMIPSKDRRDHRKDYTKRKVKDLSFKVDKNWEWDDYLKELFVGSDATLQDHVVVVVPDYMKAMNALVEKTDEVTVWNYIVMHAVYSLADQGFLPMAAKSNRMLTENEELVALDDDQMKCAGEVQTLMPWAAGRAYIDQWFDENDMNTVSDMIHRITSAFGRMISDGMEWMDEESKKNALNKLHNLAINVGWPTWIRWDKMLDSHYEDMIVDKKMTYLDVHHHSVNQFRLRRLARLGSGVNRHDFQMSPAWTNAWYEPLLNSITIPAAILLDVIWNSAYPMAVNYGHAGVVVGHEITHGYDDEGVQFDFDGTLHTWMTEESRKGFTKMAQCVIDEYSNMYAVINGTKLHLNGAANQGENIADNGGIREAYEAYQNWQDANGMEAKMPGLEDYSMEQIFFIAFGQSWCGHASDAYLRNSILTNPHSPPNFRVLGTVQNFEKFGEAFGCKRGDKMYPENACKVWV